MSAEQPPICSANLKLKISCRVRSVQRFVPLIPLTFALEAFFFSFSNTCNLICVETIDCQCRIDYDEYRRFKSGFPQSHLVDRCAACA